jgi:hypothetical protein
MPAASSSPIGPAIGQLLTAAQAAGGERLAIAWTGLAPY